MGDSWLIPEKEKILLNQYITSVLAQIEGRILPYRPLLFNQTPPMIVGRASMGF
jgi:hypothetical protein